MRNSNHADDNRISQPTARETCWIHVYSSVCIRTIHYILVGVLPCRNLPWAGQLGAAGAVVDGWSAGKWIAKDPTLNWRSPTFVSKIAKNQPFKVVRHANHLTWDSMRGVQDMGMYGVRSTSMTTNCVCVHLYYRLVQWCKSLRSARPATQLLSHLPELGSGAGSIVGPAQVIPWGSVDRDRVPIITVTVSHCGYCYSYYCTVVSWW